MSDLKLEVWPPQGAVALVAFAVDGSPKPAGSKNVIPLGKRDKKTRRFTAYTRQDGTPIFNVTDSSGEDGENWRADVRAAAAQALDAAGDLFDGPLAVRVTFFYPGPKGRYGTGRNAERLKDSADRYPHQGELADGTKLARALEDALNMVVWTDDRRVCDMWWSRRFTDQLEPELLERVRGGAGAIVDILGLPVSIEHAPVAPAQPGSLFDQRGIMDDDGTSERTQALAG